MDCSAFSASGDTMPSTPPIARRLDSESPAALPTSRRPRAVSAAALFAFFCSRADALSAFVSSRTDRFALAAVSSGSCASFFSMSLMSAV
jgi:hypothetical protein